MASVLGLPVDDEMMVWAGAQVEEQLEEKRLRRKSPVGRKSKFEVHGVDPLPVMTEYVVWKATPVAWRPEEWPTSEREFCRRAGLGVTRLMWFRGTIRFDRIIRRARRFQAGAQERIMEARNVAHQMVLRQPDLEPRYSDPRWFAEVAKVEGLTRSAPLLQINQQQNVLQLDAKSAQEQIQDALRYFGSKGMSLPEEKVDTRVPEVREAVPVVSDPTPE